MDAEGYVQEGPNTNVGIVNAQGVLVTPPFEDALAGCTVQRLLELVKLVRSTSTASSHRPPRYRRRPALRALRQRPARVACGMAA